jgi:hypothetical protein
MAERVGFEPTVEFPRHSLSRRALSTAQTPLRGCCTCSLTKVLRGHNYRHDEVVALGTSRLLRCVANWRGECEPCGALQLRANGARLKGKSRRPLQIQNRVRRLPGLASRDRPLHNQGQIQRRRSRRDACLSAGRPGLRPADARCGMLAASIHFEGYVKIFSIALDLQYAWGACRQGLQRCTQCFERSYRLAV